MRQHTLFALIASVLLGAVGLTAAKTDAVRGRLDREIKQLRHALASKSDKDWQQIKPAVVANLAVAEAALNSGSLYLAVDALNGARFSYQGGEAADRPDIIKGGREAFMEEWRKLDAQLAKGEREYQSRHSKKAPAAVRALAEMNIGRVRALYQGARAFNDISGPEAGLYYLGTASGALQSALFSQEVKFPSAPGAYPARSIAAEIHQLQNEVLAAYQPPRSIDRHPDFIRINSLIKVAGELDAAKLYYGSMDQYLEAVRAFATLKADSPRPLADLRAEAARYRERLVSKTVDHSIAALFLEKAEYRINGDKPDEPATRQAIEGALAALPAYFAALEHPAVEAPVVGKLVTVTLVRWPYT
ncbi:MAG: hypothetical protein ABI823_01425 [Bryobacteraceae bacterium]